MNPSDNKEPAKDAEFKEFPTLGENRFLPSNYLENAIKSLSNPRFLGSIHLKKEASTNNNPMENLIENEVTTKMNKSLKNTLFNPLTKILIISALVFNLIWIFFSIL